jgi:hypothetical protein
VAAPKKGRPDKHKAALLIVIGGPGLPRPPKGGRKPKPPKLGK